LKGAYDLIGCVFSAKAKRGRSALQSALRKL
jgi:hypothetical protein